MLYNRGVVNSNHSLAPFCLARVQNNAHAREIKNLLIRSSTTENKQTNKQTIKNTNAKPQSSFLQTRFALPIHKVFHLKLSLLCGSARPLINYTLVTQNYTAEIGPLVYKRSNIHNTNLHTNAVTWCCSLTDTPCPCVGHTLTCM